MTHPVPISLAAGAASSADDRRALAGAAATTAAPTSSTVGFKTRNHRFLHLQLLHRTSNGSAVTVWVRPKYSNEWSVATWLGTSGVVAVNFGTPVILEPAVLAGIDEVFLQVTTHTGGTLDAWLAGSTF